MPIESYLEDGVFGPEATAAMGEAFDAACEELHIVEAAVATRTLVATLIIAAARRGELNPARLGATAAEVFAARIFPPELDAPKATKATS